LVNSRDAIGFLENSSVIGHPTWKESGFR
jgi:hypothetical protein